MDKANRWPLVLASVPLWPLVALLVLATLARFQFGFWPRYGRPDATELNWPLQVLDFAILPMLLFAPVAVLVACAATIRAWYAACVDPRLLLTIGSFAALALWIHFDPGGFVSWWMD